MVAATKLAHYVVKSYENHTSCSFGKSELMLQKLMYLIQREGLAIDGQPVIDEDFQGWVHGPVLPELRFFFDEDYEEKDVEEEISLREKYIVANVLDQYSKYAAWTLRDMTHEEQCWRKSRIGLSENERGDVVIPLEDIRIDAANVRLYDSTWGMYIDEFDDAEDSTI